MTGSDVKMAKPKGTPWWAPIVAAIVASGLTWALTSVVHVKDEQAHLSVAEADALVLLRDALPKIHDMAERIEAIDRRTQRLENGHFGKAVKP